MIDPASVGDWIQAALLVGLIGAVGALSARALREEHEESSGRRGEATRVGAAAGPRSTLGVVGRGLHGFEAGEILPSPAGLDRELTGTS
jgi:hypothetical protein